MAVQSIIEGLRNYLAECPLLAEIPVKGRHIDWTSADINGDYGIFPTGNEPVGAPYINGTQEMQYSAQINVRKFTDTDAKRLEASAWLERFQRWLAAQAAEGHFPEAPKGCVPCEIEAVNAGLLDTDITGKKNVYMVQINLNYILNGGN